MDKIKLDYSAWSIELIKYSTTIDGLKEVSKPSLEYTNLQPFLKINAMVDRLNSSLKKFKSCAVDQTRNMSSAVENKIKDDTAGARGFTGGE